MLCRGALSPGGGCSRRPRSKCSPAGAQQALPGCAAPSPSSQQGGELRALASRRHTIQGQHAQECHSRAVAKQGTRVCARWGQHSDGGAGWQLGAARDPQARPECGVAPEGADWCGAGRPGRLPMLRRRGPGTRPAPHACTAPHRSRSWSTFLTKRPLTRGRLSAFTLRRWYLRATLTLVSAHTSVPASQVLPRARVSGACSCAGLTEVWWCEASVQGVPPAPLLRGPSGTGVSHCHDSIRVSSGCNRTRGAGVMPGSKGEQAATGGGVCSQEDSSVQGKCCSDVSRKQRQRARRTGRAYSAGGGPS